MKYKTKVQDLVDKVGIELLKLEKQLGDREISAIEVVDVLRGIREQGLNKIREFVDIEPSDYQ